MKVSIISPVYNVAPYIADTLRSLQAQTFGDFEVLLVDDHSPDNSIQVARQTVGEDPRFRFLSTPVNSGPGIARNVGIDEARGEFIAFIDSDDLWTPDFLARMVALAESQSIDHHPLDLTYCQLAYQGGPRDRQQHRNPVVPTGPFEAGTKNSFLCHFVTFSVCFLFRRQFLVDNQLRFPGLNNSEDTHFLTRCLLLAGSIGCVDAPMYIYCVREASLSTGRNRSKYKQRLAAIRSLREHYAQLCADPRYAGLRLSQYRWTMRWLYFKKGYAQALLEIFRNLI